MKALKRFVALVGACLALAGVTFLIGATPVTPNKANDVVAWNGPVASPDTVVIAPSWRGSPTEIDYIYVSNIAGGTATNANVLIKRYNGHYSGADTTRDTLVVWQAKVPGGPAAAPALGQTIAPPGGLYSSRPGDTLKIIVTMAGATSLYVATRYHEGR